MWLERRKMTEIERCAIGKETEAGRREERNKASIGPIIFDNREDCPKKLSGVFGFRGRLLFRSGSIDLGLFYTLIF